MLIWIDFDNLWNASRNIALDKVVKPVPLRQDRFHIGLTLRRDLA